MCCLRTPESASEPGGQDARKARQSGCISFGYFSLCTQRKVTRSAEGRVEALLSKNKEQKELDSSLTSFAVEELLAGMTN
jgi:hypothetical protein